MSQLKEFQAFVNEEGLNVTDSPFRIPDGAATAGQNYEYSSVGAIVKRQGLARLNSAANSEFPGRGAGIHVTSANTKTIISAQNRKLQSFNLSTNAFTTLTQDDAAASSNAFPADTVFPAVSANFNTTTFETLTFAGGSDYLWTVYSPTKYTANGVIRPQGGPMTGAQVSNTGGSWTATGTYRYAISYVKGGTSSEGNATAGSSSASVDGIISDIAVALTTTSGTIRLTFSALTSIDTTTYTSAKIYRSAIGGAQGFTTGALVTTMPIASVSFDDTGASSTSSTSVPRYNSTVLDNGLLATGAINCVATWKRRLVTSRGTTIYISNLNAPEGWPSTNSISIPSGGPVTALAVVSFNTEFGNDEYLAVFKENELWVIKGNDYTDWTLSFVDTVGCPSQSLVVYANGLLAWVDYRGIFAWNGSDKPVYLSRPLEYYFTDASQIDKTTLYKGVGVFYRKRNSIEWTLNNNQYGTNKFTIKLDVRLTMKKLGAGLAGRVADGVFSINVLPVGVFGATSYRASSATGYIPASYTDEILFLTDDSGYAYNAYSQENDIDSAINFSYRTKYFDMGSPTTAKRYHKVVLRVAPTTNKELVMDYWTNYRSDDELKSTVAQKIADDPGTAVGYWDTTYWDASRWDSYSSNIGYITFNLNNINGNAEGDAIQLRFRNSDASEPIIIYGFSIFYTDISVRK